MNAETPGADAYRDWDAAYLLGSLTAADRRAYERHLRECPSCREAIAEFVPLPGLLAQVPAEEALALLAEAPPAPAPPGLLERLGAATRIVRRRARVRVAGLVLAAAAVSAVTVLLLPAPLEQGVPSARESRTPSVVLAAAPGVPVEASVRFVSVPWGTRIDLDCSYRSVEGGASRAYVMYVTDDSGAEYAIGSWTSTPGSTMHPSLATGLHVSEIEAVDVRLQDSGRVVLTGAP